MSEARRLEIKSRVKRLTILGICKCKEVRDEDKEMLALTLLVLIKPNRLRQTLRNGEISNLLKKTFCLSISLKTTLDH